MSAMTESPDDKLTLEKVYVWELPVRLTHWLLFFSILVLSATGYYIGHPFISVPGAATDHFVMGAARAVHMYAAIVFVLAMLVRFYWLFVGNSYARLTDLVPLSLGRLRSFWKTLKYYSFISRNPDEYAGHNALAGSSYAMIFVVGDDPDRSGVVCCRRSNRLAASGVRRGRAVFWRLADSAAHPSRRDVGHLDLRGRPRLLRPAFLRHRTHRNIRFDLFRLQIPARAKSRPLVSSELAQYVPERKIGVLILGLGNVLLGDDGLGAAAVARLEGEYSVAAGVRLADGGTLGLSLLGLLADSEHVILVDAVRAEGPPGTLLRLDGEDVSDAVRDRLSPHQVGVADLLDAARLIDRYPATVTLLGLVPDTIDLAVARSTAVDDGLGELVAAIVQEVQSHGYEMVREPEAVGRPCPIRDLNRHFGM